MYLKELSLFGFKSFPDKTVLKFDGGVTAIVGPNGSGKSNFADAVRWVLAEQSNKLLRAKKSEDVIFFGSEGKSKSSFAEVSLLLDNSKGTMPIEYSEVKITRRLYRSGESEYLINEAKVRLLDIVELLAKAGFGAATYSVIGQGMVDAILISSPAERKEFFDEASGIKQFEIKREQSFRKLEQTEENMSRSRDILSELSPRLATLARTAKRAEQKGQVEAEYKAAADQYFTASYQKLTSKLKDLSQESTDGANEIKKIESELAVLNHELEKAEAEDRDRQTVVGDLNQKVEKIKQERDEQRQQLYVVAGKIELEHERSESVLKKAYEQQIDAIKQQLGQLIQRRERLDAAIAELNQKQTDGQKKKTELETRLTDLNAETQKFGAPYSLSEATEDLRKISTIHREFVVEFSAVKKLDQLTGLKESAQGVLTSLDEVITKSSEKTAFKLEGVKSNIVQTMAAIDAEYQSTKYVATRLDEIKAEQSSLSDQESMLGDEQAKIEASIAEMAKQTGASNLAALESDKTKLEQQIAETEKKLAEATEAVRAKELFYREIENTTYELRGSSRQKNDLIRELKDKLTSIQIESAKYETRLEAWRQEITEEWNDAKAEEISKISTPVGVDDLERARANKEQLKRKYQELGSIDSESLSEYDEVKERHQFIATQLEDLDKASSDLKKVINDLDVLITEKFRESFSKINEQFNHYFGILFSGGTGELRLSNEADPAAAGSGQATARGIEIMATPPGKKVQNLATLSGGERTLTSIALLAAILTVNHSPFVVFDEVDAALDEPNTVRFLNVVRELATHTQFIVITHNRETMKAADIIYGVTMDDSNVSKILSIKLQEAEQVAQ